MTAIDWKSQFAKPSRGYVLLHNMSALVWVIRPDMGMNAYSQVCLVMVVDGGGDCNCVTS